MFELYKFHFQVFIFALIVSTGLGNPLIATNKLSLATWGSYYQRDHMGPGTYAFGYDIEDPVTGNIQFKQEERHPNGTVTGNYGYVDALGRPHVVTYISDENGYRAKLEVEGQPERHFPEEYTPPGNYEPSQETDNHITTADDSSPTAQERPSLTYGLIHPFYYEFLRANGFTI